MPFPVNIALASLDGTAGVRLDGPVANDWSGNDVASAGDFNGDGFEDVVVGAPHPNGGGTGGSYVVFGKAGGFDPTLDLGTLDGSTGFWLAGEAAGDWSGISVASAGDVNADGFDDLIVGASGADPNGNGSGAAYVVFGRTSGLSATVNLADLDGSDGFQLNGTDAFDAAGVSVAGAGDVNGDGFADVIVGSSSADPLNDGSFLGASYVVFGKATSFAANLDLSALDGSNGFRMIGGQSDGIGGSPVSAAGDFNGDGFDDLLVSTSISFDPASVNDTYSGYTYVVFGKASGFGADFDLADINGSNGFRYIEWPGNVTVASAGDVNGDGFGDILVGSTLGLLLDYTGATSVIFGSANGFTVNGPGSLDGSNGFVIGGAAENDSTGFSVASAGDVNGDGFDDILIGAIGIDGGATNAGGGYVVFGKAGGFSSGITVSDLDGSNGFRLDGFLPQSQVGISVAGAGDVNGDGYDDLVLGSRAASPHGVASGSSYVVFGGAFGATVTTNGTAAAEMLIGGVGADSLDGGGGLDVFHGGVGDDLLTVADTGFELVDGGRGRDRLVLAGGGLALDLTVAPVAARIQEIEHIDLGGAGDDTLTIDAEAVLRGLGAVGDGKHVLTVSGTAGDTVVFADGPWSDLGTVTTADGSFVRYVLGHAEVLVEPDMAVLSQLPVVELAELDGFNGFRIVGAAAGDRSGHSVAAAGDVDGDGFEDLLVGAPHADPHGASSGTAYVVRGRASGFDADLPLAGLDGSDGWATNGVAAFDYAGVAVAAAGDVNGDGLADWFVGASGVDANGDSAGAGYVVFGENTGFGPDVELSGLTGADGFRLVGAAALDGSGLSVASAGDLNGDGFGDLIVGAERANPAGTYDAGASYVVFGRASGFGSDLELSSLDGSTGFRLPGIGERAYGGASVASAGDVNGDGFADLIVGAPNADPLGDSSYTGASYLVFGHAGGFTADLDLAVLQGSDGVRLIGEFAYGGSGASVASAGDVNGDGFDDVIVGAYRSDPTGVDSGASYVVFGHAGAFPADVALGSLDGSDGFRIDGTGAHEYSGQSVSGAGDVNGDGYDDLIVGATWFDPPGANVSGNVGAAWVVFGKAGSIAAHLQLSALDGTDGFRLDGVASGDLTGLSVSAAGDVNGDGFADLMVGADGADPTGAQSGATYVLFGNDFGVAVSGTGSAADDSLVGGVGDDVLSGGGGHDSFHGGAGDDRLVIGDAGFLLVDGGTGRDTLALGGSDLALDASQTAPGLRLEGIERIDLEAAGSNVLTLDRLSVLTGLGATAGGKHGLTVLGDAVDTVQFVEPGWGKSGTIVTPEGTFDRYELGDAVVDVAAGVQVPGAAIAGTPGNDTVDGLASVPGQALPTERDDVVSGLAGNDRLSGLGGDDLLSGGTGNDVLDGGLGDDLLKGGAGLDAASYASAGAGVRVNLAIVDRQNTLGAGRDTLSSIAGLVGSGFDDALKGDGSGNRLGGGGGDDVLTGGDGRDRLLGGLGRDTLNGGAGIDTASYAEATAGVTASLAASRNNAGEAAGDRYLGVENLEGSRFADRLVGDDLANGLDGGRGLDHLDGRAGNDRLAGGGGRDLLTGGIGRDTFVFDRSLVAGNVATVTDFSHADDTMALSLDVFAAAGPAGRLAEAAFFAGPAAHDADDRILYDAASGRLLYDADGLGGAAGTVFATVGKGLALAANDFTLF